MEEVYSRRGNVLSISSRVLVEERSKRRREEEVTEGEETMRGASADFIGQRAKGQDQLWPTRPVLFLFCSFLCVSAWLGCLICSYCFMI